MGLVATRPSPLLLLGSPCIFARTFGSDLTQSDAYLHYFFFVVFWVSFLPFSPLLPLMIEFVHYPRMYLHRQAVMVRRYGEKGIG
ncbi:hypothetical protein F4774DRAFT_201205 [Daldinia eschscholtzii]|nr:hypothetical protein F4774DRAFT_201205 [Daldinia eschscholtzii]